MNASAIEIRKLEKQLGRFKLGPLNLTVPQGAIYGLIGPNAAGKTTTIDLILGLGQEDGGCIRVFGLDHRDQEVEIKRRIGYVSPDVSYNAWKKVKRLIHFIRQFYPKWDDAYCKHLLESLNVGWDDKISTMSFGSRVKLGLVVALSHRPDLLLLDEPTIGVDAVSKKQIFSELLNAVQDESRTVLISSHGLTDIERFADHVGMIKDGRLLLEGPTAEVVEEYRMMDFMYDDGSKLSRIPGVFLQERSGNRWRALIDLRINDEERMTRNGAREIKSTGVTLEELFVALTLSKEV